MDLPQIQALGSLLHRSLSGVRHIVVATRWLLALAQGASDARLHLLLPRAAYVCAAAAAALSVLNVLLESWRRRQRQQQNAMGACGGNPDSNSNRVPAAGQQRQQQQQQEQQQSQSVARLQACCLGLVAAVAAPLAMVLGRRGPLPLLLAAGQAVTLLRLLHLR